ncbi:MAG: hypothetical protein ABFR82_10860 [Nitrospirota bacterium]
MLTLAKEEIVAQLKRLGINASSERNTYLRDYLDYVSYQSNSIAFNFQRILNDDVRTRR